MNSIVLNLSDQHVTFSIEEDETKFFIVNVYASNSYAIEIHIWNELSNL